MRGSKLAVLVGLILIITSVTLFYVLQTIAVLPFSVLLSVGILVLFASMRSHGHISARIYLGVLFSKFSLVCILVLLALGYATYYFWNSANMQLSYTLLIITIVLLVFFLISLKLRVKTNKYHISKAMRFFR